MEWQLIMRTLSKIPFHVKINVQISDLYHRLVSAFSLKKYFFSLIHIDLILYYRIIVFKLQGRVSVSFFSFNILKNKLWVTYLDFGILIFFSTLGSIHSVVREKQTPYSRRFTLGHALGSMMEKCYTEVISSQKVWLKGCKAFCKSLFILPKVMKKGSDNVS